MSASDEQVEKDIQAVLEAQRDIALDAENAASARVSAGKLFLAYVVPEQEQQREQIKKVTDNCAKQAGLFDAPATNAFSLDSPELDQKIKSAVDQALRAQRIKKG